MLLRNFVFPGVLLPGAVALVLALFGLFLGQRGRDERGFGALAVASSFLAAYVALTGWPRFPPVEATQRLFYLSAVGGLLAFALGLRGRSTPWLLRIVAMATLLGAVLRTPIEHTWGTLEAVGWLVPLLVLGVGMTLGAETDLQRASATRVSDWAGAVTRVTIPVGIALAIGLSGSARLAQLAGAVACGALVFELAGRLAGRRLWSAADGLPLALVLFGLLLSGHFYAALELVPAALCASSIVLLALPARHNEGRDSENAPIALVPLVPLVVALGMVVSSFLQQEESPYDYDYESARAVEWAAPEGGSSHSVRVGPSVGLS